MEWSRSGENHGKQWWIVFAYRPAVDVSKKLCFTAVNKKATRDNLRVAKGYRSCAGSDAQTVATFAVFTKTIRAGSGLTFPCRNVATRRT